MKQPMIEVPSNWGGNREGAGAGKKPEGEKKSQLYIMIKNDHITMLGGKDNVKQIMTDAVNEKIKDIQV